MIHKYTIDSCEGYSQWSKPNLTEYPSSYPSYPITFKSFYSISSIDDTNFSDESFSVSWYSKSGLSTIQYAILTPRTNASVFFIAIGI